MNLASISTLLLGVVLFALPHSALARNKVRECRPGPWGRIEYQRIYLQAPDWIVEQFPLPSREPRWTFPLKTVPEVRQFLATVGVAPTTIEEWLTSPKTTSIDGYVTVFPTPQSIEALPGHARAIINPELGRLPHNEFCYQPIFITDASVEEWLEGTSLPPAMIALVERLTYLEKDALIFSDIPTLLSHSKDDAEARSWMKEITRTHALLAYLRLGPKDDLAAIANYWFAGQRRKDLLPLMESLVANPEGDRIDLTHLLPAQPRKLIYTYPSTEAAMGQTPNCHWSTLNFFNFYSQDIYLDLKLAATGVLSKYARVPEATAFGDVFLFVDQEGNAHHSCVYVADNLVYTKNGGSMIAPWILTTLDEVKRIYLRKPGTIISVFRRNDLRQASVQQ